jgi:ABC-type transporter Mla subunit MlaD
MTRLSPIKTTQVQTITTATLTVETRGEGFTDITDDAQRFITQADAWEGALFLFLRHTSASLTIQENADPDVQRTWLPRSVAWLRRMPAGSMIPRVRTICRPI